MMLLLRILLLPFTALYALAILLRNLLYKAGVLTRMDFEFPIVCVGNLSAGGTGKTPHIEWLIKHLQHDYKIGVLSRGYMRKTSGYVFAGEDSTAEMIGDEPLQIKQKFPEVVVAVCENRVLGVPDLLADAPDTQVILMDDGFQHLAIKAGFNTLLTPFDSLFTNDWLLPSGRLREFRSAYQRAQVIIVTKCPPDISKQQQQEIIAGIQPLAHQTIYFTGIRYHHELVSVFTNESIPISTISTTQVLALAGIAKPDLFKAAIQQHASLHHFLRYRDHHHYTEKELKDWKERFELMSGTKRIILTTEKDAKRLQNHSHKTHIENLPVYYWPMEIYFINGDEQALLTTIKSYVAQSN